MSQQGLKSSSHRQVEEEGHVMQFNKPLDKTNNQCAFVSSKSNSSSHIINHANQNSFIDDDLVTWLQYPMDDGVACHDMFHHWPPPSPAPALDNFTPSPVPKDLPLQQNEALMVDIASDGPLISVENDRNSNAHLNQASHSEGHIMQAVLKQRHAEAQQHEPLFKQGNEVASAALGAALRQVGDDARQSVAKDCRKLSQLKLLPQDDERAWAAKEAHLGTDGDTHSRHSEKRIVAGEGRRDKKWAHATQLRHKPQRQGPAYLNLPIHHNAVGSSPANVLQKEAYSANCPCRKGEKDLSRKPSATTDSAQAKANPAADAALALGASRAEGVIRPSGMEAFSKVRTSLQPIRPSKLGSPLGSPLPVYTLSSTFPSGKYSFYPTGYSPPVLLPRGSSFGFHDSSLPTQPVVQQTLHTAVQPHWFRPCASFPSMGSQEHQLTSPLIGGNSNSSKDSHLESSTTVFLGSQGTEELSVMLNQVPHKEQDKDIGVGSSADAFYGTDTLDMQKFSGLPLPYRDKKDDVVFSGGSETSESFKETFSGSKRKLDDSECQSEDAEGESAVNSQARSSSSKRTRANEVHNLSERRRRNRINDKMNALRELIPNATKSNKAALLDEAIDYLKNLQLQLQVMSMRTGVSLSPMVLPPGLPHMQLPQASPIHPMGIGTTGGCSLGTGLGGAGSTVGEAMCDMTYGVPARPLTNLSSPDPTILQPSTNYSNIQPRVITAPESASSQFPHPFVHATSQPFFGHV